MVPQFTEAQRQQLDDQGFFVLENLFTHDEMDHLAAAIETHQRRHEEAVAAKGGTEGISRAGEIAFTAFLAEGDPVIREFALRPEFVEITTKILGPDIDLYWNQSVFKQPEGKKQFPWHQDDGYAPVTPSPYLTLWLALNDATVENGCISVIPASHKNGLVAHEPSDIGLQCYSLDAEDQGLQVPIKAGSLIVFYSLLFHKSGTNKSQDMRKAYILQYSCANLKDAITGELMPDKVPVARQGRAVRDPVAA